MEGPNDGYRPESSGKRAGESSGQGIRDWQKNTWFGPAPQNSNPFDEPEDAPELRESRSENVNQRMGDFWQPQHLTGQNAVNGIRENSRKRNRNSGNQKEKRRKLSPAFWIVPVVLIAILLILRFAVFTVRDIQVTGNKNIPASEIIRISGVRNGDSILTLDEKTVGQRIASDYRLQFKYMIRELPQTVVLAVREREECCWLTYCGITYVMDKNRMVMREEEDPGFQPKDLVEVKGLEVRSNTMVGQEIVLGNEKQQEMRLKKQTSAIRNPFCWRRATAILSASAIWRIFMRNFAVCCWCVMNCIRCRKPAGLSMFPNPIHRSMRRNREIFRSYPGSPSDKKTNGLIQKM